MAPRAAIFGCEGLNLTAWERSFFAEADPLGFILFQRNCDNPAQVSALVAALRETVGRSLAPVLIDQEGGRVARLKPPHWRAAPPTACFGDLARRDRVAAERAVKLNTELLAQELGGLGIDVHCLPLLDVPVPGAHDVIGDRAFADEPDLVAALGRVQYEALLAAGIMPVIKHLPGHGRALVDSHEALPRVTASQAELEDWDFRPFRALADAPWGMTAHVVYEAFDPDNPATTSAIVVDQVIRGSIGFQGLLLSDDLGMDALDGSLAERAARALAAGCDIALHCSGVREEMSAVAGAAGAMTVAAVRRFESGLERRQPWRPAAETAQWRGELDALLDGTRVA